MTGLPRLPGPCGPGPGNEPVEADTYQCSLGLGLQATVDSARRITHALGLRPYRVHLTWARRSSRQVYEVVRQIELMPVVVSPVDDLDWELTTAGRQATGDLVLSEVSPAQVTKDDLLGHLDGEPVGDGVEFWYEVTQRKRCPTDPEPSPGRYTPSGVPGYDAPGFQWVVRLTSQQNPRGPADQVQRDQTWTRSRWGTSVRR